MIARLLVSPPGFACSHSKSVHLPCNDIVSGSWLHMITQGTKLLRNIITQHIQESLKVTKPFSGGAGDKARRDRSHVHFK